MVAQFMSLAVDDAAETAALQETLEREGARVWWHEDTLQVLWPKPAVTRMRRWLERSNGRVRVLDERPVEIADELLGLRRAGKPALHPEAREERL